MTLFLAFAVTPSAVSDGGPGMVAVSNVVLTLTTAVGKLSPSIALGESAAVR